MSDFQRYGVYFTPGPGAFATAGAEWLGWDIATGKESKSPHPDLTSRPRRYGFHATMKPPFSLVDGQTRQALADALHALCQNVAPVVLERLELKKIGSFMAFTAGGDSVKLNGLAATAVRELDHFRAAPSDAELARRRQAPLTPEQEENLNQWGYPHVMNSFRFHMTLTGPVPRDRTQAVKALIQAHFKQSLPAPMIIDSLTLVGEDENRFFHEIERVSLSGDTR